MAEDHIRYDLLTQAALRGVVRTVLADVAKRGLPGEHHFKITFNTMASGVQLSERLRKQYPQHMTIVLQYQFWDLAVDDQAFEVGLSFGGVTERVAVPFEAITAFFDPAAQFGFQFEPADGEAAAAAADKLPTPTIDAAVTPAAAKAPVALPAAADAAPADTASAESAAESGQVVSLDRFRKKKEEVATGDK